jgi:c-di-GMP-related signal transduction protein
MQVPEGATTTVQSNGLRYYARQPILNARGAVYAYELLFRSGPESAFRGDGDQATRTMLDNTVMFGLERLTGGLPAFVNCTLEALTSQLVEVLPPSLTVLEILETLEVTPSLIAACEKLKDRGFGLALDDFVWRPELEPLIEIADYIKVDFTLSSHIDRLNWMKFLRNRHLKLLAEKVETREEFEQACDEGFTLFQGYYFCRPTLVEKREIPANQLTQLELLRNLQKSSFDLRKMSKLVERDAAITYRLLRLVNSPMYLFRKEVRSVEEALLVVGEKAFRRIATLAITTEISGDQPAEILRMALMRARFCELAAPSCHLDATEQYLLGLFSLLPAMLRIPMDQAISALALREEIHAALLGEKTRERGLLCWMEASERGDWSTCDTIRSLNNLDEVQLTQWAADSVEWAETTLRSAS